MAMLQTWVLSFILFFQSFLIPMLNPPMQGPVNYGGDPYVDPKASITAWLPVFEGGEAEYTIVIPNDTGDNVYYQSIQLGAKWLKEFAAGMTGGATFAGPVTESAFGGGKFIALGLESFGGSALDAADIAKLSDEGFIKKVIGEDIFIYGIGRGTMYGCASFIEDELDCRWFTPELKVIPSKQDIKIDANLSSISNPALECRDIYWSAIKSPEFAAFHRENSASKGEEQGYGVRYFMNGCHTIGQLVPASECDPNEDFAFRRNYTGWQPEYIGKQNVRTSFQRCLTSQHVIDLAIENCIKQLTTYTDPDYRILSVSADDNYEVCECDRCLASDKKYGGPSGTNIWFVNQVAQAVEAWLELNQPGRRIDIDTFAYLYSEDAPKNPEEVIVPRRNVIVRLCSINSCFSHPQETCGSSRRGGLLEDNVFNRFEDRPSPFGQNVVEWGKLCAVEGAKLYIWDYTTNFNFYPAIFPNLQTLSPNMQFYTENGVKGTFQQGYNEGKGGKNGEFAELRVYLMSKILWNPKTNVEHIIDEFMAAYYGAAAPQMKEYLDVSTRKAMDTIHMSAFGRPEQWIYFRPDEYKKLDKLFDRAEQNAADDPAALANVKLTRISLRCYKANMLQGEFSFFNPCRLTENKRLFHDIVMAGIDAMGGMPIVEPYDTYIWLHRPFDWAGMGAWIDFVDDEKIVPLDLAAYRAHDPAACEFCSPRL